MEAFYISGEWRKGRKREENRHKTGRKKNLKGLTSLHLYLVKGTICNPNVNKKEAPLTKEVRKEVYTVVQKVENHPPTYFKGLNTDCAVLHTSETKSQTTLNQLGPIQFRLQQLWTGRLGLLVVVNSIFYPLNWPVKLQILWPQWPVKVSCKSRLGCC